MIILDTDHLSLLMWKSGTEGQYLRGKLAVAENETFATTIVTDEEQTRCWFAYLSKPQNVNQMVQSYGRLTRHLDAFRKIQVLDFDLSAAHTFSELKRSRIRVGTMDLKIASIVLTRDSILLSRNLTDFRRIPNLQVEEWTGPSR